MKVKELKHLLRNADDDWYVVFDTIDRGYWFVQSVRFDLLASNGFGLCKRLDDQFSRPVNALVLKS